MSDGADGRSPIVHMASGMIKAFPDRALGVAERQYALCIAEFRSSAAETWQKIAEEIRSTIQDQ